MTRTGLSLAAAVAGLLALPTAASALTAVTTGSVPLRAGPAGDFPVVDRLPAAANVYVNGCVGGYRWCDVSWRDAHGWIRGDELAYLEGSRRVSIIEYGPRVHLPIIAFSVDRYWDRYYRGRPFYSQRSHWRTVWRDNDRRGHSSRRSERTDRLHDRRAYRSMDRDNDKRTDRGDHQRDRRANRGTDHNNDRRTDRGDHDRRANRGADHNTDRRSDRGEHLKQNRGYRSMGREDNRSSGANRGEMNRSQGQAGGGGAAMGGGHSGRDNGRGGASGGAGVGGSAGGGGGG